VTGAYLRHALRKTVFWKPESRYLGFGPDRSGRGRFRCSARVLFGAIDPPLLMTFACHQTHK
jgi:hypothetical protein